MGLEIKFLEYFMCEHCMQALGNITYYMYRFFHVFPISITLYELDHTIVTYKSNDGSRYVSSKFYNGGSGLRLNDDPGMKL